VILIYHHKNDIRRLYEKEQGDKKKRAEAGIRNPKDCEIQRLRREVPGRSAERRKDDRKAKKEATSYEVDIRRNYEAMRLQREAARGREGAKATDELHRKRGRKERKGLGRERETPAPSTGRVGPSGRTGALAPKPTNDKTPEKEYKGKGLKEAKQILKVH